LGSQRNKRLVDEGLVVEIRFGRTERSADDTRRRLI
jgi:hypothetical protein